MKYEDHEGEPGILDADTREFSLAVAISLVTRRPLVPLDDFYAAIAFVLGYQVFGHELAERGPWDKIRAAVVAVEPRFSKLSDALMAEAYESSQRQPEHLRAMFWEGFLEGVARQLGRTTIVLPRGTHERSEAPEESLRRVAGDRGIVIDLEWIEK